MNTYLSMVIDLSNNSKYTKWYYNIIVNALSSTNLHGEKHHILPKCFAIGGEHQKDNIVVLTYKEHYVVHRLLAKMFEGKRKSQMLYAMWSLTSTHQGKRTITSQQYSISKRALLEARKNFKHTDAARLKMSKARKGKQLGKLNPMYGRTGELSPRYGLPSSFAGRCHTIESKQKMSDNNIMKRDAFAGARIRWTKEARQFQSDAMVGSNNNNSKIWSITNLLTNETEIVIDLKQYCVENSWNYNSMITQRGREKPYKKHKIVPVN